MTRTDTCRLNDYLQALSIQDPSISSSTVGALTLVNEREHTMLNGPTTTNRSSGHGSFGAPELILSLESSDEPTAVERPEDNNSEEGSAGHLQVTEVVDDCCSDGESCNIKSDQHSRVLIPQEKSKIDEELIDSDEDRQRFDGEDIYDSDLDSDDPDASKVSHAKKMRKWKLMAKSKFERMFLECIVNTDRIAPEYRDIHVSQSTIHALERVTSLSLTRQKAFGHGVLNGNKVTGAILYGPPGTGKSVLAKGMAKQSGFTMIAVSTAEMYQKCHGDDEKVIKALFSMGRKLYPSIIFIDEADAMLGARKAGEKRHIRAMLNQFLMEWDGLTSGGDSPFILLATNRPFDLDPAVLRRAPVQIHMDIPTVYERMGILQLLLQDEILEGIRIPTLAYLTEGYTGSDLKNLCVTAATECVSSQATDTTERCLTRNHFFSAMKTIRATGLTKTMANEMGKFEKNSKNKDIRYEEE